MAPPGSDATGVAQIAETRAHVLLSVIEGAVGRQPFLLNGLAGVRGKEA